MIQLPFTSLSKEPAKLPYIPKIIEEDKKIIKKNLSSLKYDGLPQITSPNILNSSIKIKNNNSINSLIPKRQRNQIKSCDFDSNLNIFNDNLNNFSSFNLFNKQSKYFNSLNRLKKKINKESRNMKSNDNFSGIFITNMSQRLTTDNTLNNYNNYSNISLSRSSSSKKRKRILSNKNRETFVKSLDFLNEEINNDYNNMKENFNDYNDYGKFMINKCNNVIKLFDRRFKIQSDEFINERIEKIKTEGLNYKFNKYFDKFFSMKKNFDLVAMSKLLLKHRTNKKKLEKEINEKKIQKQREKYINLIEQNVERAKKVQMLSDEYMRKNNRLKNKNINYNNYDNNDINEIEDDNE